MRLNPAEQDTILAASALLPAGSHVWLFGSRVNNQALGGDIDLWIELPLPLTPLAKAQLRSALVAAIWQVIGEQRIDIVFSQAGQNDDRLIIKEARQHGVRLA
ncbi:nucleotidyltransferase domain-containing protein [Rhodobacteraceae bacterium CH30]|nr:nucleotidyltransferase domain-containing protein [Rhodobacteraceae bacterium CH30]